MSFESSVNSEGIETDIVLRQCLRVFESSVNSEGIETEIYNIRAGYRLRAV